MSPLHARRSLVALGLVLLSAAGALAEPAPSCRQIRGADTPDDPADDVSVCRQDVWFHHGERQVGNLAALDQDAYPSWSTTKPSASLEAGGGGAYVASSTFHQLVEPWDPKGTPRFEGSFTGDLDTILMSFYLHPPVTRAQGGTVFRTNLQLLVDNQVLYQADDLQVPMSHAGIGLRRITIALLNAYGPLQDAGLAGAGRSHAIRVAVVGTGLATSGAVFFYDAVEAPAGMVFNADPKDVGEAFVIDLAPPPPPE